MINTDDILSEFFTKKYVTVRRSISSDFTMESGLLDKSVTGVYFDDGHPLIRQSLMDAFKKYQPTVTTYTPGTYQFGEIVDDSGQLYESLKANNTDALNVIASWRPTDELSLFHRSVIKRSVEKLFSDVLHTDPLVDNVVFQKDSPSDQFEVDNTGKRVGFLLTPKNALNMKYTFNRVGTQFNGSESFDLFLYKGNTLVSTFSATADKAFAWDTAITFDLEDDVYFLFYEQTGLTNKAINPYGWESLSFTDTFINPYLYVQPFIAGPAIPLTEIKEGEFRYGTNWGLSLDFTVCQDLTKWAIRNLSKFSKGIQLQYAFDLLEEFVYNPYDRSNSKQRNTQSQRLAEVEIMDIQADTVARRLMGEKKKLKKSIEQMAVNDQSFKEKEDCIWEQSFV